MQTEDSNLTVSKTLEYCFDFFKFLFDIPYFDILILILFIMSYKIFYNMAKLIFDTLVDLVIILNLLLFSINIKLIAKEKNILHNLKEQSNERER